MERSRNKTSDPYRRPPGAGTGALDPRRAAEDRAASVAWARGLVGSGGFCVLDSETTGLKPPVQFVEVGIVDADARTLFEGTVRPVCPIEPGATRVHGHTARSLAGSPPFWEVYPHLLEALWGRRVVVYNAPYDRRVWDAEVRGLGARGTLAGSLPPWECAMRRYAAYAGESPPRSAAATATRSWPGGTIRPSETPWRLCAWSRRWLREKEDEENEEEEQLPGDERPILL